MKLKNIIEGITNNGSELVFDFTTDSADDIIRLKLQPFNKRFALHHGKEIYVGYKYKTTDTERLDIFRDALKSNSISEKDETLLVNKAVENFIRINPNKIDVIVSPYSKGSALNKLATQLNAKYPGSILADGVLVKRTYDEFLIGGKNISELSPEHAKLLLPMLKNASKTGEFKMKAVSLRFRRLITNFMKFSNNQHRNIATKIASGNVLVLDDIYSGGNTFNEMFSIMDSMGAKMSFGFALFASK